MDFTTASPINKDKLKGQNKRLFDWLAEGNSIHCFSDAMKELRIGYLNSRASDLINKHGVQINKKFIKVPDVDGNLTTVVEYSLTPFTKPAA